MTSVPDTLLTRGEAERIVAEGARRYFESRRARVDEFVERHFSFSGSLTLHRKAVGWDMLKALVNIASVPPECMWVAKAWRNTCGETRSGLGSPAATAVSLISSRAACRVRALAPLRTEWNSQGEGTPPE